MNAVTTATGLLRLDHVPGGATTTNIAPLTTSSCYAGGLAYMLQQPRGKDGTPPWPKKESGEVA